jgi:Fur family peroxide stress response transcriptional regulator
VSQIGPLLKRFSGILFSMDSSPEAADARLRRALEETGHRFTEQRAAVYRFLSSTTSHPNADEVFRNVRGEVPGISLATVYKSLETLVTCGLAAKLTYSDGSARYDARMDPHHHARCVSCGNVMDVPGHIREEDLLNLARALDGFAILGYRLELTGFCSSCSPHRTLKDRGSPMN